MRTNGIAPEDLRGMGVQCSKLAPCPPPSTGGASNAAQATLVPSSVSSVAMDIRNAHDNDMDDSCCAEADAVADFDDNDNEADAVIALPADDDHGQVSHPSSSAQSRAVGDRGSVSMPVVDFVPSSSSSAPADAQVMSLSHSQEEFLSNLPPDLLGDALEQLARSATVCRDHQIAEKLDAEAVDSGGHIVLSDHEGCSRDEMVTPRRDTSKAKPVPRAAVSASGTKRSANGRDAISSSSKRARGLQHVQQPIRQVNFALSLVFTIVLTFICSLHADF